MKIGIIGSGAVGSACLLALVLRGSAREIVILDRDRKRARAVAMDIVRTAGFTRVLSSGTYLDSLRFRHHLARRLNVAPASVEADVLGEHGTSEVFMWSSARVGTAPVLELIERSGGDRQELRRAIEHDVRYANIAIIEGNQAWPGFEAVV